jgi:hypothetical protein
MRVALASRPATPASVNEDFVAACPTAVVVIDGVSVPEELDTGCHHGTPWFAAQLGTTLLRQLATSPTDELAVSLAHGIEQVRSMHDGDCDLAHPGSPSAAVAMLREHHDSVEYLVLADCTIVLALQGALRVVTDDRIGHVAQAERAGGAAFSTLVRAQRTYRNRDGGFWVASVDPTAARHAVTGHVARSQLDRAVVLTDGAARLVERFQLATWTETLTLLDQHGPDALLALVRDAERHDPDRVRWPRSKQHDDATVAVCGFGEMSGHQL